MGEYEWVLSMTSMTAESGLFTSLALQREMECLSGERQFEEEESLPVHETLQKRSDAIRVAFQS
jgi:hypothetical protein